MDQLRFHPAPVLPGPLPAGQILTMYVDEA